MTLSQKLFLNLENPLINNFEHDKLEESKELLDLAFKNNVELLYLSTLKKYGKLKDLSDSYEEFLKRKKETQKSMLRMVKVLNELEIPYAITKSLRPYPGIPNDTDILFLGEKKDFRKTIDLLLENGFSIHRKYNPIQTQLFDSVLGKENLDAKKRGGRFYYDFYNELSADNMPYVNSEILKKYVIRKKIEDVEVSIFNPFAEMIVILLHSVIMHRTFPLEVFLTVSYYFSEFDENDVENFAEFITENQATKTASVFFSLFKEIFETTFGFVPRKILALTSKLKFDKKEVENFRQTDYSFPYICSFNTWLFSVLEKLKDKKSLKGFTVQAVKMINPIFMGEVLYHIFSRKRIKKHSEHV